LAAFALVNGMVNLRYPAPETRFWLLLPSVDVVLAFAGLALWVGTGRRVSRLARCFMVALLVLVRLVRIGDGVQQKYYGETFHLTDLRLVPNIVSFVHVAVPSGQFAAAIAVAVMALLALVAACYAALAHAERYLAVRAHLFAFGALAALSFVALLPLGRDPSRSDRYFGGLAASAGPRLLGEARFLLGIRRRSVEAVHAIAEAQNRFHRAPFDLAKLHRANVLLIFVESYGRAVFDRSSFLDQLGDRFRAFESEAKGRGFALASGTLTSPISGGHSWLAHSTLATGIEVTDEQTFDLVSSSQPKTIADFFRDAGYRTVLVQPGTTSEWPAGDFYRFDQKYYAWDFDYAGPPFAWATMPDQYVLDFIRRKELAVPRGPLLVEYMLVSSHAPWSALPTYVDRWDELKNGELFRTNPRVLYPVAWPNFDRAAQAYIDSIGYDFEVLQRYLAKFVLDDSLLVILGDHQPVAEISGRTPFTGVPVHVLCRDPALVEPFVARGFERGMFPPHRSSYPPMSSFLLDFLRDFSTGQAAPRN
jgi:hypothetical protein